MYLMDTVTMFLKNKGKFCCCVLNFLLNLASTPSARQRFNKILNIVPAKQPKKTLKKLTVFIYSFIYSPSTRLVF